MSNQSTDDIVSDEVIREIVEDAVDAEIANFTMAGNLYEDYALDSLGAAELHMGVFRKFKVRIPETRMPDIKTAAQLQEVVRELLAAKVLADQTPALPKAA